MALGRLDEGAGCPEHRQIWNKEGMNGQQDLICPNPSSSDEGLFLSPGQGQEARCREQHPEREPGQAWGNIHKPNHELGLIRLEKMDVCSGYSDIPSVTSHQ